MIELEVRSIRFFAKNQKGVVQMIELSELQQLVAFAEEGTLSKAAEALHISQPSLSRSMQNIEDSLQVPLFDRRKNRLALNDNGLVAVEYARKVLEQMDAFISGVKEYERAKRTITVGSCAPAPLWSLLPALSQAYPGMMISSETLSDSNALIDRLKSGDFLIVVLPFLKEDTDIICRHYIDESLFLSVQPTHRLASRKEVAFSDFDGENMILFSDLGIWQNVHTQKMPHSKFLIQNERFAFNELIDSSVLPCFSTNLSQIYWEPHKSRVNIPISDPEATVAFYVACLKKNQALLNKILRFSN